jgi:serine protease
VSFRIVTVRMLASVASVLAVLALLMAVAAAASAASDYAPGEVVVGYSPGPVLAAAANVPTTMGLRQAAPSPEPGVRVLRLPRGVGVWQAIARLRRTPGIAYAVPDYLAHIADPPPSNGGGTSSGSGTTSPTVMPPGFTTSPTPSWIPNDRGRGNAPGDWQLMQWNFLADFGVNAPEAWANLIADGRPGGRGVTVAILDTGVAYRNWHNFRKAPDFAGTRFVHPVDFVAGNRYPLDREGHGTFVAGIVAEATNNGFGLTGLAYGASVMPVRVLDRNGWGDAVTIARGIRYAVRHGANVINLSLEFDPSVRAGDIPGILSAIRYAHRHGVIVVSVSGNEGSQQVAFPARAPDVISVGATTRDKCLADYSNGGHRLDLVAPGGGDDSTLLADPNCNPSRNLPDISQMTFFSGAHPARFGYPGGWFGTSMAAPEVAATAALVIASHVLGAHPTPDQVLARLEQTAQPLGGTAPNSDYGYGLVDAGAATAPITPPAPQPTTTTS